MTFNLKDRNVFIQVMLNSNYYISVSEKTLQMKMFNSRTHYRVLLMVYLSELSYPHAVFH